MSSGAYWPSPWSSTTMSRPCSIAQCVAGLLVAAVAEVLRVPDDGQRQARAALEAQPDLVGVVGARVVADQDVVDASSERLRAAGRGSGPAWRRRCRPRRARRRAGRSGVDVGACCGGHAVSLVERIRCTTGRSPPTRDRSRSVTAGAPSPRGARDIMRAMETPCSSSTSTRLDADLPRRGGLPRRRARSRTRARRRAGAGGLRRGRSRSSRRSRDEFWKGYLHVNETKYSNTQPDTWGPTPARRSPRSSARPEFVGVPRGADRHRGPDARLDHGRRRPAPDAARRAPQHPRRLHHPPRARELGAAGEHPALPQRGVARRVGRQARALGQGHDRLPGDGSRRPATGCWSSPRPPTASTATPTA